MPSISISHVGYTPVVLPRIAALCAAAALAQEPYKTLPRNYSVEFENASVRISRVRYSPGDKLPEHAHPALPTVYVYLTDGGPIRFTHTTPKFTVERAAVQAGTVRFNRNAQVETHETEYLGANPSEYLRIELKTEPGPKHRDARLRAETDFPWEDEQIRIGRDALGGMPCVVIDIASRSFRWLESGSSLPRDLKRVVVELKTMARR